MSVAGEAKYYPQITASAEGLPQMLASNRDARPLPSSLRHSSVANTNGNQNASGRLSFQIPANRASVIKPGSAFVVFDITVTGTDTNNVYFHNCGTGASCFRKVSVQIQNQVVELLDNYHIASAMNMFHNMASGYSQNDRIVYGGLGEATGTDGTAIVLGAGATAGPQQIVPLMLGSFNAEQGIPLYLINSPILVDIELNAIVDAIYAKTDNNAGAGTLPTALLISNAYLCYEEIALDQSFVAQVKQSMLAGQQFSMPIRQITTVQTTSAVLATQVFGVNYSSLNWVAFTTRDASTGTTKCLFEAGDGLTKFNVYLDSRLVNNYPIDSVVKAYAELNKALGKPFDASVNSHPIKSALPAGALASDMTPALYRTDYFFGAVNCRRFLDANLSMCGSPVQTIQIEATFSANQGTVAFVLFCYDSVLLIDANGAVQLLK